MASSAKALIVLGIVIVVFGLVMLGFSHVGGGRGAPLPGDIVLRRRNLVIYFPIVSSIVISLILSLILLIIAHLRR